MKTIIPIGPYHPLLEEPEFFKLVVEGETVVDMDIRIGWNHRGIEKLAETKTYDQLIFLVERICGICSTSHPIADVLAQEDLAGAEVPERAQYIRSIVAELERLHSHLLWLGLAGHFVGYNTVFMWVWKAREPILDLFELITGNRNDYAMLRPGGVRRDIYKKDLPAIRKVMDELEPANEMFTKAILDDPVLNARLKGVGVLSKEDAIRYCVVGPTARASGLKKDVRQDWPYLVYGDLGVKAITPEDYGLETRGDVYDRIVVRLLEVGQSLSIIERCLEEMPEGEITSIPKIPALLAQLKKAEGEGIGRHEAPRGEVIHYVRLEAGVEAPVVWKVKAPTYSNLLSWYPMFEDQEIADIPIVTASIDPCICCLDRVHIVRGRSEQVMWKEELLKLSWEKTRKIVMGNG